tara:strand:- start:142 stop:774 length:633 start_codon:yes stop_codon:yes gene_type:complete
MTVLITPEHGVPFSDEKLPGDLATQVEAAANTALELAEHGLDLEPNKEDRDIAAKLAVAYADDPEKTSKKATVKRVAKLTPASLVLTNNILTEFGQSVVESATQIRHLVTNKLLLESDNEDAKVRMRALELLGKISDVGLFAEKSEVTITHQSSDDLRARLRGKLEKLVEPIENMVDAVVIESDEHTIQEDILDIEAELGAEGDVVYDDD